MISSKAATIDGFLVICLRKFLAVAYSYYSYYFKNYLHDFTFFEITIKSPTIVECVSYDNIKCEFRLRYKYSVGNVKLLF